MLDLGFGLEDEIVKMFVANGHDFAPKELTYCDSRPRMSLLFLIWSFSPQILTDVDRATMLLKKRAIECMAAVSVGGL